MPDVTITTDLRSGASRNTDNGGPVWTDSLTGYFFFQRNDKALVYKKTTDGGATWGAEVVVRAAPATALNNFAIWFDRWTPGDSGALIHIVWIENGAQDGTFYRNLDTSTDTLSTAVLVVGYINTDGSVAYTETQVHVTKARGGNLYCGFVLTSSGIRGFRRSVNGGTSWVARADVLDATAVDNFLLLPGNEADTQDIWCVYWGLSVDEITLKVYDDSANSWSETLISGGMVDSSSHFGMAASVRQSDNHMILVAHSDLIASHDLKVWDINGTASIVAKTNVFTATANRFFVTLTIDQNTDDLYVGYAGVWTDPMNILYKISTDGGAAWGTETQFLVTEVTIRDTWSDRSVDSNEGRWEPA